MPRIDDSILNCTVYLYESEDDANEGVHAGGTGFFVAYPYSYKIHDKLRSHVYAVTNHHVIERGFRVIRLNRLNPTDDWLLHEPYPLTKTHWQANCPGPDLAIALLDDQTIVRNYYWHMWLPDGFVTWDYVGEKNIGLGSDVFIVGRFIGHPGDERNLPVVRFGSISMMPMDRFEIPDIQCGPQKIYLVEARSTSGMSGSPVFIYQVKADDPGAIDKHSVRLLGIEMGHMSVETDPAPHRPRIDYNAGLMMVIPAWELRDLLEREDMVMERKEIERREYEKAKKNPPADDSSHQDNNSIPE